MTEQSSQQPASRPDYASAPRLMWQHVGGREPQLILAVICGIIAGIAEVVPAWGVWRAVTSLATYHSTTEKAQVVLTMSLVCLIAVVTKAILFAISTAMAHLVAFGIIADIRLRLGRAWNSMSVGTLGRVHSAQAKTVALDHCEKMELFIAHALPETAAALTVWLGVTLWLFLVDWRLAAATIVLVPVAFATIIHAMKSNGHRMGTWAAANNAMGAAMMDFLTAMPVIRVFNRTGQEHQRTADAVRRNAELQSSWGKAFVTWGAPFSTLVASSIVIIAPVAAWLLTKEAVDTSTVLLFLIVGPIYPVPLVTIYHRLVALPMLSHGAVEIEQHLANQQELLLDPSTGAQRPAGKYESLPPEIRFEHVSFSYVPGSLVLDDVSFTAEAGKVTALVGLSGAGKSTIGELVAGFYQPDTGTISIGGIDSAAMREEELYAQVAMVFQKPHLIAGTIRENIALACPDAAEEQLRDALEAAAADGFIKELPEGIETVLGEGGSGLSGGQRQRLAIARAFVADRPVLILDEATAATDPDNEALIQEGLTRLTQGRTVIVIAHRLGTIHHADCIIVMDEGRIVETGTHEQLLTASGPYARLWGRKRDPKDMSTGQNWIKEQDSDGP